MIFLERRYSLTRFLVAFEKDAHRSSEKVDQWTSSITVFLTACKAIREGCFKGLQKTSSCSSTRCWPLEEPPVPVEPQVHQIRGCELLKIPTIREPVLIPQPNQGGELLKIPTIRLPSAPCIDSVIRYFWQGFLNSNCKMEPIRIPEVMECLKAGIPRQQTTRECYSSSGNGNAVANIDSRGTYYFYVESDLFKDYRFTQKFWKDGSCQTYLKLEHLTRAIPREEAKQEEFSLEELTAENWDCKHFQLTTDTGTDRTILTVLSMEVVN